MEPERLKPLLEAALLASTQPMTAAQLAELFDEPVRPAPDQIAGALTALQVDCAERGVELIEVGSGFRYQVKAEVFPHIAGLWTERQSRYSRALLETLSLVAYRQPITRGEIEQIRGVAVATSILRTLEEREWVRIVGHRDVPGKPALYGTTKAFLDYFQLRSLDELPPLSALRDLDTLEPELNFEVPPPAPAPGLIGAGGDEAGADGEDADGTDPGEDEAPGSNVLADLDPRSDDGEASAESGFEETIAEPARTAAPPADPAHDPDAP
jgi:segregation and condensation protein B